MRCSAIQELLTSYLDMELSLDDRRVVKEHLAGCPACERELNGFKKVGQWVQLIQIEPDHRFQNQVLNVIRSRRLLENKKLWNRASWLFHFYPAFKKAALAFIFLLAVSAAYFIGYHSRPVSRVNELGFSQYDMEKINQEIDFYKNYEIINHLELLKNMDKNFEEDKL